MINRRTFLKGCAGFSAMAAVRHFGISDLVFQNDLQGAQAAPGSPPPNNRDLLIFVFVRGGMDGLNLVVPFNTSAADRNSYYNTLRSTLSIPAPNSSATRKARDLDGKFAIHPDAARGVSGVNVPNAHASDTGGLHKLFADGDLAIVHACGSPDVTGSHFDTELYVDHAGKNYKDGWLTRYLAAVNTPPDALVVAPQNNVSPSLAQWYGAQAIPDSEKYGPIFNQWVSYNDPLVSEQMALMAGMAGRVAETDYVTSQYRNALNTYSVLSPILNTSYTPPAPYLTGDPAPDGGQFGRSCKMLARLAKASIANPLRVAVVDVGGGWDTHDNQGTTDWGGNARFPSLIMNLSNNLKALHDDLNTDPALRGRFTIAVVSEFGRVLYQNDSAGCDHGAGNVMLLIGSKNASNVGNVNGGQVFANWPGLQTLGYNDGLQITTDYRRVLADVLYRRMGATPAMINDNIFPGLGFAGGLGYSGLGLLS